MNKRLLFFILIFLFISSIIAVALNHSKVPTWRNHAGHIDTCSTVIPNAVGFVNDFENIFTAGQADTLTAIIKEHEKASSNQIAIVTLKNTQLGKCSLDDFSLALAKKWAVGTKEKNNGIVIAICTSIKKIRIQNGYGIEKIITNEETKAIIDSTKIPFFKQQKYYEGTLKCLLAIIKKLT